MSLKVSLIKWLGGYATVEDALLNLPKESEERNKILTETTKRLYNTIGIEDLLTEKPNGEWMFEGRTLSKEEVALLKTQAKSFVNSKLYKVLDADCRYQANKRMFTEATTLFQLESGKNLIFIWDIIKTRLKRIG